MPHLLQDSFPGMPSAYTSICPLVSRAGEKSLAEGISKPLPTSSLHNGSATLAPLPSLLFPAWAVLDSTRPLW